MSRWSDDPSYQDESFILLRRTSPQAKLESVKQRKYCGAMYDHITSYVVLSEKIEYLSEPCIYLHILYIDLYKYQYQYVCGHDCIPNIQKTVCIYT